MRLFVLVRHGQSELNVQKRVNGDPSVDVALTEQGRTEADRLGDEIANIPFERCVHTRFGRTLETAKLALRGRDVPLAVEPLLDDVDVGELEGKTIDDYREWKKRHTHADAFPGGESLDDTARRYARAWRKLLTEGAGNVLVVCHEIPVRYAVNAAAGSPDLDHPLHDVRNATPYLFDADALERAAAQIERLLG
jgi:probable phosphoglycerate mutase